MRSPENRCERRLSGCVGPFNRKGERSGDSLHLEAEEKSCSHDALLAEIRSEVA